jgi:hypothetical protein
MPTYKVTDPNTGKKYKMTGDRPPTQEEVGSYIQEFEGKKKGPDLPPDENNVFQDVAEGAGLPSTLDQVAAIPSSIGHTIMHPIDSAVDTVTSTFEDARDRTSRYWDTLGNDPTIGRAAQLAMAPIPFIGNAMENADKAIADDDLHAAGRLGGNVLAMMLPEIAKKGASAVGDIASNALTNRGPLTSAITKNVPVIKTISNVAKDYKEAKYAQRAIKGQLDSMAEERAIAGKASSDSSTNYPINAGREDLVDKYRTAPSSEDVRRSNVTDQELSMVRGQGARINPVLPPPEKMSLAEKYGDVKPIKKATTKTPEVPPVNKSMANKVAGKSDAVKDVARMRDNPQPPNPYSNPNPNPPSSGNPSGGIDPSPTGNIKVDDFDFGPNLGDSPVLPGKSTLKTVEELETVQKMVEAGLDREDAVNIVTQARTPSTAPLNSRASGTNPRALGVDRRSRGVSPRDLANKRRGM